MARKNIASRWAAFAPHMLSILRIVAAFVFLWHGSSKLFDYPTGSKAGFDLFSQTGIAGILEFFGGILILAGFFTRPIAFILAGEMAFAYLTHHAPRGFIPIVNKGELSVLFCFLWLYISAIGGGPWSVDAWLKNRKLLKESTKIDTNDRLV